MSPTDAPSVDQTPDLALLGDEHIRVYRETNGERGYMWNGVPTLLLTTTGRKSGEPRTIAIIYAQHGDGWILIASKGGAPEHPQWYRNLLADPKVTIQVKGDIWEATARTAEGAERETLWKKSAEAWPRYDLYQSRTERQIPVVVFDPVRKISGS